MRASNITGFGARVSPFTIGQTRLQSPGLTGRNMFVYPHNIATDETPSGGVASNTIQLPFGISTSDPKVISLVKQLKKPQKRTDGVDGLDLQGIDFTPLAELINPKTNYRVNLDRLLSDSALINTEYPLCNANLEKANLSGANLSGANLSGANFGGVFQEI